MKDLILDKDYKKGSRGKKVKLIQEWLSIHGIHPMRHCQLELLFPVIFLLRVQKKLGSF